MELKESGVKLNNIRIGIWRYYTEQGIKQREVEYQGNYYKGIYREFYSNGTLKQEGNYDIIMQEREVNLIDPKTFEETKSLKKMETSVKQGKWFYLDENGKIVKEEYFSDGKLIK